VAQYRSRAIDKFVFNSTKLLPITWLLSFFLPANVIHFVCHGFPFIPGSTAIRDRIKEVLFFKMLRRVANVICVSGYVQSIVVSHAPGRNNIVLARNTIEPSVASALAPKRREIPEPLSTQVYWQQGEIRAIQRAEAAPLRAVSLAEINFNKGIDALCQALVPYRDLLSGHFEWHVYGEGKDRSCVQKFITENGLLGIVVLHGFREDARELLSEFDLLLMPSRNEAFGMVALEAAASGLYVCGTAIGGVPEAIVSTDYGRTFWSVAEMAIFLADLTVAGLRPKPPRAPELDYWEQRYRDWSEVHLKAIAS
jgi:glycosyltransferase involved in cell wall biosynthesis